ncbi:clostripain-related cysteine peptidase [Hoylesella nanceiensis]|uniref:clostripain-related cysteine peptidase n=1 Tax=Hoylesella nanceiensis TaxID=425941 RepID=UPI0028ED0E8E|nr:clostripain-related cysteine peptidase [Hoylesella nanceiensis]
MNIIKNAYKGIFVIFLALSLVACNDNKEDEIVKKEGKTIFVYMPWTASATNTANSLHDNFIQNIEDIKSAIAEEGGLKNTRLVIFIDSLAPKYGTMYELMYHNGLFIKNILKQYTPQNSPSYTTEQGLTTILRDVVRFAPASKYSMIIGSHGVGWLPAETTTRSKTRFFGGTTPEYQTNISTLANSIKATGIKMQYIMFDDCYMSNIETAYELRNATSYLIGCTSEIMAYGMPYHKMWKELSSLNPNYQTITNIFHNFYSNYQAPQYNCGAIGVTNCEKTEEMANLMKEINQQFTFNVADTTHVQKLDGYSGTIFYDMKSYVDRLCSDTNLKNRFNNVMSQVTPYYASTSRIYTAMGQLNSEYININSFSGITISDPSESQEYSAKTAKKTTSWWKATH